MKYSFIFLVLSLVFPIVQSRSYNDGSYNDGSYSDGSYSNGAYSDNLQIENALFIENKAISPHGITLITRPECGWSKKIIAMLGTKNIDFTHIIAKSSPGIVLNAMRSIGRTFPAVYVDGEYIGGYTEAANHKKIQKLLMCCTKITLN